MLEVIYVVRHGFRSNWTVDPNTGDYYATVKSPTGIASDPALASYGVDQANDLAKHLLKAVEPKIDVIYSSPFYRCLQTLKPTTDMLLREEGWKGGKIKVENGLGEFYGEARFDHPSPAPLSTLETHFENLDMSYTPLMIPSEQGESIVGLHERIAYVLDKIITALDNDPAQPKALLICTHAASMIAIGRALTGDMPEDPADEDFRCGTCALSKFVSHRSKIEIRDSSRPGSQEDSVLGEKHFMSVDMKSVPPVRWRGTGVKGGWSCVENGNCTFLPAGEERGWNFRIEAEQYQAEYPEGKVRRYAFISLRGIWSVVKQNPYRLPAVFYLIPVFGMVVSCLGSLFLVLRDFKHSKSTWDALFRFTNTWCFLIFFFFPPVFPGLPTEDSKDHS